MALKPSTSVGRAKVPRAGRQPFRIIGIGASAGGLEAFKELLGALTLDTGLVFAGMGRKKLLLNAHRIADDGKHAQWILLAMEEAKAP